MSFTKCTRDASGSQKVLTPAQIHWRGECLPLARRLTRAWRCAYAPYVSSPSSVIAASAVRKVNLIVGYLRVPSHFRSEDP